MFLSRASRKVKISCSLTTSTLWKPELKPKRSRLSSRAKIKILTISIFSIKLTKIWSKRSSGLKLLNNLKVMKRNMREMSGKDRSRVTWMKSKRKKMRMSDFESKISKSACLTPCRSKWQKRISNLGPNSLMKWRLDWNKTEIASN